jgi:flagellar basal-body rod modification protein FlgD
MSNVNAVSSANEATGKSSARPIPNKNNELDINDFLKMLIAQMSNQDPLGGGSSGSGGGGTDYIAQLAQFSILQQMSALSTNMASSQAYSLIGKYVFIQERPDSKLVYGKVDGAIKENGINYLMVGGKTYEMSKVYAVQDEHDNSAIAEDYVLKCASLIGKQVTAKITGEDKQETTITGTVEKIKIQDGTICLVVNGKDVKFDDITEIAGEPTAETTNI